MASNFVHLRESVLQPRDPISVTDALGEQDAGVAAQPGGDALEAAASRRELAGGLHAREAVA